MKTTIDLLKKIIEKKNAGHRRLSMRTLAKKIQIPSGRLSELFSGKRRLTDYYLEKIFFALKLSDDEIAQVRHAHYKELYGNADSSAKKDQVMISREHIDQLISWKLYAVMSFLETTTYTDIAKKASGPSPQLEKIAKSLKISTAEIRSLVKVMESVGFIQWNETTKKWSANLSNTTTGYDIPSKAIQNYHSQVLDLAKDKLPSVPVTKRDYSSMTLTVDPKDVVRAKKMLREFRQKFTKKLEEGGRKEVYQLSIQFFPLTDTGE